MAYPIQPEHPEEHPVLWGMGKLLVAAIITGFIIMTFAGAAYLLGTTSPQSTMPATSIEKFKH